MSIAAKCTFYNRKLDCLLPEAQSPFGKILTIIHLKNKFLDKLLKLIHLGEREKHKTRKWPSCRDPVTTNPTISPLIQKA
jgi:hypothetical protein